MSTITYEERETRLNWMLRPFTCAMYLGGFIAFLMIAVWSDVSAVTWTAKPVAYVSLAVLILVNVLIFWGCIRVARIVKGHRP